MSEIIISSEVKIWQQIISCDITEIHVKKRFWVYCLEVFHNDEAIYYYEDSYEYEDMYQSQESVFDCAYIAKGLHWGILV